MLRAAIQVQNQSAIGWNIPMFSGVTPHSISAEQWVKRVYNAIATGEWTNDQTIEFWQQKLGNGQNPFAKTFWKLNQNHHNMQR